MNGAHIVTLAIGILIGSYLAKNTRLPIVGHK